jgi:copper(I)-binding protein
MNKVNLFLFAIFFSQILFSSSAFTDGNVKVSISDAWVSEAPTNVSVLAGYANIHNPSNKLITLIAISSQNFSKIEIHRSVLNREIISMEKQESLEISAENTIKLSPGDFHLMLFEPNKPLRSGDTVTLNFLFSDGHIETIEAKVKRRDTEDHSHQNH